MRATQQMTKGSPWKLILAFSFPLMLGNLCQQFYIMVDAAIVGQILGVSAIAAVGATEWIIWMMQGLVQGFTQGFSIKMAQDYGAEDYSSLRKDVDCFDIDPSYSLFCFNESNAEYVKYTNRCFR